MHPYRKILPLLKRAFQAARAQEKDPSDGTIVGPLFANFEEYAATFMTDLSLADCISWANEIIKQKKSEIPPHEIQECEEMTLMLFYAGHSSVIEDIEPLEDHIAGEISDLIK